MRSTNNKKAGFTIIELLTVVAVVGLLASIIMVSFRGATQKARIARGKALSTSIQNILGVELVGAWDFEEGSGLSAKDASGYENNGDLTGHAPTWATEANCILGKCLQFNGTTYANCGNGSTLAIHDKSFTIEAWVKPAANLATGGRYTVAATYSPGWIIDLVDDAGVEGYRFYNGTTAYKYTPSGNLLSLEWTYIVVTRNLTTGRVTMYLNGEVGQSWSVASVTSSANSLLLGRRSDGYGFNGHMDNIRVYALAITTGQIKSRYLAGLNNLLASGKITAEEYKSRASKLEPEYAFNEQ